VNKTWSIPAISSLLLFLSLCPSHAPLLLLPQFSHSHVRSIIAIVCPSKANDKKKARKEIERMVKKRYTYR
jgi:hypothetical protein